MNIRKFRENQVYVFFYKLGCINSLPQTMG